MVNEEILNDERVRNRIIQLEYDELTAAEIRQIYLEETGKVPPTHIDVYHSMLIPMDLIKTTYLKPILLNYKRSNAFNY